MSKILTMYVQNAIVGSEEKSCAYVLEGVMYAKNTKNFVSFFNNAKMENTEKVAYGRVSESIKLTGSDGQPLMQNGKQVYRYETWNVRLVGNAKKKFDIEPLEDKSLIILTEWSAHISYNKDLGQSYPYLVIMDYVIKK